MRNELRRRSISVTDEDLTTEMTHELLQEQNIEDIKRHLELTSERYEEEQMDSEDFRFQSSFRTHFVKETDENESEKIKAINVKKIPRWLNDSPVLPIGIFTIGILQSSC